MSPITSRSMRVDSVLSFDQARHWKTSGQVAGILGMSLLMLAACTGQGLQEALTPFQTQQNNQMTQTNAAQAQNALSYAGAATCEAAKPFVDNVNTAAMAAADLATLSRENAAKADDASNQLGTVNSLITQIGNLRLNNRPDLDSAKQTFRNFFITRPDTALFDSHLRDGVGPASMTNAAENYLTELRRAHSDAQAAVFAVSEALRTTALAQWLPVPDPNSMIAQMQQKLDSNYLDLGRTQAGQDLISVTSVNAYADSPFEAQMRALAYVGDRVAEELGDMAEMLEMLKTAQVNLTHVMTASLDKSSDLSSASYQQAVTATQNASAAIDACGGLNPFSSIPAMPEWNSTFWDIES